MAGYGYEVDFLPVGNGDKSGDAIVLRYGEPGSYKVMVVDVTCSRLTVPI